MKMIMILVLIFSSSVFARGEGSRSLSIIADLFQLSGDQDELYTKLSEGNAYPSTRNLMRYCSGANSIKFSNECDFESLNHVVQNLSKFQEILKKAPDPKKLDALLLSVPENLEASAPIIVELGQGCSICYTTLRMQGKKFREACGGKLKCTMNGGMPVDPSGKCVDPYYKPEDYLSDKFVAVKKENSELSETAEKSWVSQPPIAGFPALISLEFSQYKSCGGKSACLGTVRVKDPATSTESYQVQSCSGKESCADVSTCKALNLKNAPAPKVPKASDLWGARAL